MNVWSFGFSFFREVNLWSVRLVDFWFRQMNVWSFGFSFSREVNLWFAR